MAAICCGWLQITVSAAFAAVCVIPVYMVVDELKKALAPHRRLMGLYQHQIPFHTVSVKTNIAMGSKIRAIVV